MLSLRGASKKINSSGMKNKQKLILHMTAYTWSTVKSGENQESVPAFPPFSLSSGGFIPGFPSHTPKPFPGVSQGTCLLRKCLGRLCLLRCSPFRSLRFHSPFCLPFPSDMQRHNTASLLPTQPNPKQPMLNAHRIM